MNATRGTVLVAVIGLVASSAVAGLSVNSGFDSAASIHTEAKARKFNIADAPGFEYSLAIDDDGLGAVDSTNADRMTEKFFGSNHSNAYIWGGSNTFSLAWDGSTLSWTVNGSTLSLAFSPAETMNYLQFSIVDRAKTKNGVTSSDVLDMTSLELDTMDILPNDTTGWQTWYIADSSLASGFTVNGTFDLASGPDTSALQDETSKILFNIGNTTSITPIPTPGASILAAIGLAALSGIRRRSA